VAISGLMPDFLVTKLDHVANLVRALINDLWGGVTLGGHPVYQVSELSGPYSNPTRTDLFRYSQSFLVAIRAAQVVSTKGVMQ